MRPPVSFDTPNRIDGVYRHNVLYVNFGAAYIIKTNSITIYVNVLVSKTLKYDLQIF